MISDLTRRIAQTQKGLDDLQQKKKDLESVLNKTATEADVSAASERMLQAASKIGQQQNAAPVLQEAHQRLIGAIKSPRLSTVQQQLRKKNHRLTWELEECERKIKELQKRLLQLEEDLSQARQAEEDRRRREAAARAAEQERAAQEAARQAREEAAREENKKAAQVQEKPAPKPKPEAEKKPDSFWDWMEKIF